MKFTVQEEVNIKRPKLEAWIFHTDITNISRVLPPMINIKFKSCDLPLKMGSTAELNITLWKFSILNWKLKIIEFEDETFFVDTESSGKFKYFAHKHEFIDTCNGEECIVRDTVNLELHYPFNVIPLQNSIKFGLRQKLTATKKTLESHQCK